tara:strand:- start:160 stop:333 length:174 start_codon:yes stop_codon:yes gene_type:complete
MATQGHHRIDSECQAWARKAKAYFQPMVSTSTGTTAEAENQTAKAATSQNAISASDR